jgi:hypothetical protein
MTEIPQLPRKIIELHHSSLSGEQKITYVDLGDTIDFPLDRPEFHITEEQIALYEAARTASQDREHQTRLARFVAQMPTDSDESA